MKLLFIAALMVVWVSPLRSTSCKTVLRVKQEAMEYACQTQKGPLQKAFKVIPIPLVNGGNGGILGIGLGLVDNVVKLAGVEILEVKLPEFTVKMMPNVGVQVSIDSNFHIRGRVVLVGNIDIKAGAGVLADMRITRTAKGFPILSVTACKTVLGDISITGGTIGILPTMMNMIKGHFESILSEMFCVSVSNVFLGLNGKLGMLVGASAFGKNRGIEYTMPSAPVVTGDYMDLHMNVEYEVDKKVIEIPNGAKDFTLPPDAGNKDTMVNLGLSHEFFISMFAAFHTSGIFNLEIPSDYVSVKSYLTTSVLGSHIPEISWKYKETLPVSLNIKLILTPIITLEANFLMVQISPVVEVFVVTGSMSNQHLMTLNVGASLVAKLDVSKGRIMTSVGLQGDLKITMASSSFGKCKTNPSVLMGYMRDIFIKAYLIQVNADLSIGVSLPSLPNVDLIHEVVEVKKEYAVVSCDVQYVK